MEEVGLGREEVEFEKGAENRGMEGKGEIEGWGKDVY